MIEVNKNVIDLNEIKDGKCILKVKSYTDEGRRIPWIVDSTSSEAINYEEVGIDELRLTFDLRKLKKESMINLLNSKGEREKIKVLPNLKESKDRKYIFKVKKYDIIDKDKVVFKITSKVNGEKCKWECIYNGRPLSYKLKENGTSFIVELQSITYGDITGHLRLEQDESGNIIEIWMNHHANKNMDIEKIKLTNC